jgi:hypothetical protein
MRVFLTTKLSSAIGSGWDIVIISSNPDNPYVHRLFGPTADISPYSFTSFAQAMRVSLE